MKTRNSFGFTFIELSIVIIILTLLISGSIDETSSFLLQSQVKSTEQKISIIQNALDMYVLQHGKLPCPSGLKKNNGKSASSCSSENSSDGIFVSGNSVRGAIPYEDLNLSPDLAHDAWNSKFTYIVDFRATSTDMGRLVPNIEYLTVYNNGISSKITDQTLYIVISHGKNRLGSFDYNKNTKISTTGISSEELINTTSTTSSNFNKAIYFTNFKLFDDIVVFKNRGRIVKDIELEDISCYITNELISSIISSKGISFDASLFMVPSSSFLDYNETIDATDLSNTTYQIKCFKYGRLGLYKK